MSQSDIFTARSGSITLKMSNIEAGKGSPTLAAIERIAQALEISSAELLT